MRDVSPRTAMWIAVGNYLVAAVCAVVSMSSSQGGSLQAAVLGFLASGMIWMERARGSGSCMQRIRAHRSTARAPGSRRDD